MSKRYGLTFMNPKSKAVPFGYLLLLYLLLTTPGFATTKILILGDSITEGYGVDMEQAYPTLLEKALHDQGYKDIQVINGGVSGATTASGLSRFKNWYLRNDPQIVMIALGANDGLRGIAIAESKKNILAIIKIAKEKKMQVLLAGMQLPPNYGKGFTESFAQMYVDIAKQEKIALLPFLLEEVGGKPAMNLADGIHPNAKGHERICQTVLPFLRNLLSK